MSRHTTFKFCLDPTVEQSEVLARHAGASRFAYNQCLRIVKTALTRRQRDHDVNVPWTKFDLINVFNAWKKTDDAGRVISVDTDGVAESVATGLVWRHEVCQQVFEEAAADLGSGLKIWADSRLGTRGGKKVGFPRFKKKTGAAPSFRLRNKQPEGRTAAIRLGDRDRHRSVTLPGIGQIAVHDDTRRLRRMVNNQRAKILFATVTFRGGRWWVSLNVEAANLHRARQHPLRAERDDADWVGVDRGLSAFVVAATVDGVEVARSADAPKPLRGGMDRQRRMAKALSRKQKGSSNQRRAASKLGRHHHRIANVRRDFLHRVSNALVKTHDRLVLEDLNVSGMLKNHALAQAISDASWAEFARLLHYKQAWRGGVVVVADRWFPSSKTCSQCGTVRSDVALADRMFVCGGCGYSADRDRNAATNLARWGQTYSLRTPDLQAGGRATNARRREGAVQHPMRAGETSPDDVGTDVRAAPAAGTDDAREGRCRTLDKRSSARFRLSSL